MRVLVNGSSGKLGSVTVKLLANFRHRVSVLDISSSATTNLIVDVKDKHTILRVTEGFDAVIHTAALHGRHLEIHF
ncbi:NAD-dependent epimerase/dehydratase family protein [Desertivirga arenae]|uniref:NAD-dependent epimerase/dehydratase family protein n=1 Tax=Desertivirga arenae TaxID=2810309 RepID=UPI001A978084|nr:NAD-dependent epimerase/dehydratase family protein [Pedobacter sp. SYSU D00823]